MQLVREVSLQQAIEASAMTGLILSHLMNGVMDCIQVQSLCSLGQIELAGGSAVLVSFILSGFAGISKVNFYVLNNLILNYSRNSI